jgi:hypothetical protein
MWRCVATGVQDDEHAMESMENKPARMGAVGALCHEYRLAPRTSHGRCLAVGAAPTVPLAGAASTPSVQWRYYAWCPRT